MNEKRFCVCPHALALLAALSFLGFALAGGEAGFSDVPAGHWAAEAVGALREAGILVGYPDGTFAGERTLTRYEMAVIIAPLLEGLRGLQVLGDALTPFIRIDDLEARVLALERELEFAVARAEFERLQDRVAVLEGRLEIAPPELAPEVAELEEAPPLAEAPTVARRPLYVGVMSGFVSSTGTSALGMQVGYDRLLGPLGLAGRLFYDGGADELRLTANVQARFAGGDDLDLYFGLGLGSLTQGMQRGTLVELPFGAEYFLEPQFGLVVQMVAGVPLDGGPNVGYLSAGFNIRF